MVVSFAATASYRFGERVLVVRSPRPAILKSDVLRVVVIGQTGYVANRAIDRDIG